MSAYAQAARPEGGISFTRPDETDACIICGAAGLDAENASPVHAGKLVCDLCIDGYEPIGLAEIVDLLGVKRATVDSWQARSLLPERDWTVGGRPAWRRSTITRWAEATGRLSRD